MDIDGILTRSFPPGESLNGSSDASHTHRAYSPGKSSGVVARGDDDDGVSEKQMLKMLYDAWCAY